MRSAPFLAILLPALQAANDFAPVRAIFEKSCIRCHSGDSPRGKLDLTSASGLNPAKLLTMV